MGEIIACEAVPKSKKLLCSKVKIGSQVKQIVSGIKAYYSPEEMVGKKVMVLVNLKPATLAGVLSEGMLLCAEDAEGNLALMKPEKDMPIEIILCKFCGKGLNFFSRIRYTLCQDGSSAGLCRRMKEEASR